MRRRPSAQASVAAGPTGPQRRHRVPWHRLLRGYRESAEAGADQAATRFIDPYQDWVRNVRLKPDILLAKFTTDTPFRPSVACLSPLMMIPMTDATPSTPPPPSATTAAGRDEAIPAPALTDGPIAP